MFLFFFSPPHISLISIFTFLFFFLSIALRLELYPLIFTFLFSFLLLSSLALRLLQSIQEAPLNVLLPLRLRWVSFAFFFFGSNLISFKIVILVCILIESSINFVYGFDYLYEFVCGFDEFGSRFRTILMVLWCVHDDFGLGFLVSFD